MYIALRESGSEALEYDDVIHNKTYAPREGVLSYFNRFGVDGRKRFEWKRIFLKNGKNSPFLKISAYVGRGNQKRDL